MRMETVKPDGRGRVPLARFTDQLADQYLVKVSARGVVTLVPATVRASIVDDLETINPNFEDNLAAAVADGAAPSEFWASVRPG